MLAVGACLCVLLAGAATALHLLTRPAIAQQSIWMVTPGTSTREIVRALVDQDRLEVPTWLALAWLRATDSHGALQAGEYRLARGSSAVAVFAQIRRGDVIQHSITFAEGLTTGQWLQQLAEDERLIRTEDLNSDLPRLLGTNEPVEGRFFPDTYQFIHGTTDVAILRRAFAQGRAQLEREWGKRQPDLPLDNLRQALVLASIVEKETGLGADRPRIAQVFMNRLSQDMRLQSDPTVIYGLREFDGDLRRSDLRRDGPYNTYMRHGLPPTPICNPGLAAIRATLHPEPGDYLYFVARGDGSSQFSKTLVEHNRAVRRYQLEGAR